MHITFRLTLQSDYHVGAGHGLGARADSALLRDGDRVPVLRGSTIEGLLRDALWRLLHAPPLKKHQRCKQSGGEGRTYCDGNPCPVCAVFGTPAARKRWRISSARPVGTDQPLGESARWTAGDTGSQIAARVRVSPRSRRAEARKLFKEEEGDGRLAFIFTVACPDNSATAHDEASLLVAAARMVRRMGSGRQRGRGECRVTLIAAAGWHDAPAAASSWQDHLLDHFRSCWLDEKPSSIAPATSAWVAPQASTAGRRRFRLLVRADEPIVVARRAEAGNIYDCTESVTGPTLLGALAEEAAARWNLDDPQIYAVFLEVFRQGGVRFAPLYPAYYDKSLEQVYPAIPAPLDVLVCKAYRELDPQHNTPASHAVAVQVRGNEKCPQCGVPLVSLAGFLAVRDGAVAVKPEFREEMHPQINPLTRRAATGNLYGYVALDTGQFLLGELECRDSCAWDALCLLTGVVKEQAAFILRLGKATRRGYGQVTAWLQALSDTERDPWRGTPLQARVTGPTDPITLTLLTDAIVADPWGRFYQTLEGELLKTILGEPVRMIRCFCKTGFVDHFNNHLGLPRWRDIALKAGSAVGFTVESTADFPRLLARMQLLEEQGIGVRKNEGFGQVVFNHPVYRGGAGVRGTGFGVPEQLRLAAAPTEAAPIVKAEADKLRDWSDDLRDNFEASRFRDEKWDAVARWLFTNANRPLDRVEADLGSFGDPRLLTPVNREPKDRFTSLDAQEAVQDLQRWFRRATQLPEAAQPKAIRLLANHIAAAVERKGG